MPSKSYSRHILQDRWVQEKETLNKKMKVNEKIIFGIFEKLKKVELIEYLKSAFHEMDDRQRRNVFLELQSSIVNKKITSKKLYSEIIEFYKKSIKGYYYAPFDMNSKNFMYIPNETDEWFSEVSYYFDESTKLVEKKEFEMANQCFEKLYEAMEELGNGEVVFADEYGTWMMVNKTDYNYAYIKSLSKTENAENFAEKVIPLLITDSVESFTSKIYSKIRKLANSKQFKEVQEKIRLKNIKTS